MGTLACPVLVSIEVPGGFVSEHEASKPTQLQSSAKSAPLHRRARPPVQARCSVTSVIDIDYRGTSRWGELQLVGAWTMWRDYI